MDCNTISVEYDGFNELTKIKIEVDTKNAELALWWFQTALHDLVMCLPKIEEYGGTGGGSADLRIMGDNLAELLGWEDATDAVKQELAIWFYTQGKTGRLVSDYQQQRPGKQDTWTDVRVYAMMAARLQAKGVWP